MISFQYMSSALQWNMNQNTSCFIEGSTLENGGKTSLTLFRPRFNPEYSARLVIPVGAKYCDWTTGHGIPVAPFTNMV